MNIEERLRHEIANSKLSLREIARRAGVNVQVLLRLRDGSSIHTAKADAICAVFGLRLVKSKKGI